MNRSRQIWAIFALLVITTIPGSLINPEKILARGDSRNLIPPPPNYSPDLRIQSPEDIKNIKTRILPFPLEGFRNFYDRYRTIRRYSSGSNEKLEKELATLLPPGAYRFSGKCALTRHPGVAIVQDHYIIRLDPECLEDEIQSSFHIAIVADGNEFSSRFVRDLESGEEMQVVASLIRTGISKNGPFGIWQLISMEYVDPYLEILRTEQPDRTRKEYFEPSIFSRSIPRLFSYASTHKNGFEKLNGWMKPGSFYQFNEFCPIKLIEDSGRNNGDTRRIITIEITCISDPERSRNEIILTDPEYTGNFIPRGSNSIFAADLKYAGILQKGSQFYPTWDTIKNLRLLDRRSHGNIQTKKR